MGKEAMSFGADGYEGASSPLSGQINLLGRLLGHAVREHAGEKVFAAIEKLRQWCREETEYATALSFLETLSEEELSWLVRAFTLFFNLSNQAENQEIIRKNAERDSAETLEQPRNESIFSAVHELVRQGLSFDEALAIFHKIDIQPTFTAHPTEASRQAVLHKQREIAEKLALLEQPKLSLLHKEELFAQLSQIIQLMLFTETVRHAQLSVYDEIHNGLFFLRKTIWATLPELYRTIRHAFLYYYGVAPDVLPIVFRYRSWIGGDCDGNPNITPAVMRHALKEHHRLALEKTLESLRHLWRELSVSSELLPDALASLWASIAEDEKEITLDNVELYQHEPFRLKLAYMMARVREKFSAIEEGKNPAAWAASYHAKEYVQDLELLHHALIACGLETVACEGLLADILVQARTFGFYMTALDVRQHSEVHEIAVADLLKQSEICADYASLSEVEKRALLTRELMTCERRAQANKTYLPETTRLLETFTILREYLVQGQHVIGQYIVSMTHDPSDLLEVLFLAKETGIWQYTAGRVSCLLQIAPLLEMIEDLNHAEAFLTTLFSDPLYDAYLTAHNRFQEIMLGYSDSNKDGGYFMANWMQYNAQDTVARVCAAHHIEFRLFHGRGGSVGRGGGRANQAIFALPPSSCNGRLRVTEQGEIISFRYSLPKLAHRHLEQLLHAVVVTTAKYRETACYSPILENPKTYALFQSMADEAMKSYRQLIEHPTFWSWYVHVTPIAFISKLPIASRPVSRKNANEVDFSGLRAIPWVFSWTQCRYNVPGWYGLGKALKSALEAHPEALATMQRLYQESPYFMMVISNAERELARANLSIAKLYTIFSEEKIHAWIQQDYDLAVKHILAITQQEKLLDRLPVIQNSIARRNPYASCLHVLQLTLMKRFFKEPSDKCMRLVMASINGIAAALQSTG